MCSAYQFNTYEPCLYPHIQKYFHYKNEENNKRLTIMTKNLKNKTKQQQQRKRVARNFKLYLPFCTLICVSEFLVLPAQTGHLFKLFYSRRAGS